MTENHGNGHDNQTPNSNNDVNEEENPEKSSDIIELSDIAIGITPEDDAIVELTEEIIDEAFVGFTGATSELIEEDERVLDLSSGSGSEIEDAISRFDSVSQPDIAGPDNITRSVDDDNDHLEDDISKELDDYFEIEEDGSLRDETVPTEETAAIEGPGKKDQTGEKPGESQIFSTDTTDTTDTVDISSARLDNAIERVIRKMFAEKIDRILDEVIETTVTEEINQLKDYLTGITGKKE